MAGGYLRQQSAASTDDPPTGAVPRELRTTTSAWMSTGAGEAAFVPRRIQQHALTETRQEEG